MSKLKQALSLEEFDSAFDFAEKIKEEELFLWKIKYGFVPNDLKQFIKSRDKKILEAVLNTCKQAEKENKDICLELWIELNKALEL